MVVVNKPRNAHGEQLTRHMVLDTGVAHNKINRTQQCDWLHLLVCCLHSEGAFPGPGLFTTPWSIIKEDVLLHTCMSTSLVCTLSST